MVFKCLADQFLEFSFRNFVGIIWEVARESLRDCFGVSFRGFVGSCPGSFSFLVKAQFLGPV